MQGESAAVPPWRDTTMSTEAPGSQQLLLGFTLYFSGAVVRTCGDPAHSLMLFYADVRARTHTHSHTQFPYARKRRPAHLEGHLVFGHVAQDDEALFLHVSGTEAELLRRAAGEEKK